jgi:hypothetical protein
MGYGYVEHEPFTSMRALLEVTDADAVDGQYGPQVEAELDVVSFEEQDEDESVDVQFRDWFPFKEGKDEKGEKTFGVGPGTKLEQLIVACKGQEYIDRVRRGEIEFEPRDLAGSRFFSKVGTSKNGKYSRKVYDTISPIGRKKKRTTLSGAQEAQKPNDREGEELPDIPEPSFSDLTDK